MTQSIFTEDNLRSNEGDQTPFIEPSLRDALPHYLPLGVFPLFFMSCMYGGWWLLPTFLFMSVAGGLDRAFGEDGVNMNPKGIAERRLLIYNIPLWTWGLLWVPTLIFGLWQILIANAFVWWQDVLLVFLLTMEAQAVFIVGHELVHRRTTWERRLGEFLLACCSYPQYSTEHVYVHHAKVGTPYDVGSAPKGKSFWKYFPEEVVSNLTNSWKVACERLKRRGFSRWHYSNPFWYYLLALGIWYGIVYAMGGIWALPIFLLLGFSCVFSMKISNYFQHYGLRRILLSNGRWEKILPRHSWNADWKFSNWMFFNVQRHADHHSIATRPYPQLQTRTDEAPVLPSTYGDMLNLALRPKSWFKKMDPLVDQWRRHFYPEIGDWAAYDSDVAAVKPDALKEIIEIFGVAPRLAGWIERHPELLDNLQSREFSDLDLPQGILADQEYESIARRGLARIYWTHDMGVQEMRDQLIELPTTSVKETAEIIRSWSNDKAFQIGMHVVRGNLTPAEASLALANLAEASLCSMLDDAINEFLEKVGEQQTGGIALVLLGDLATREVYPNIEIDALLIHDGWRPKRLEHLVRIYREMLTLIAKNSLVFRSVTINDNRVRTCPFDESEEYFKTHSSNRIPLIARSRMVLEHGYYTIRHRFALKYDEIWASLRTDEAILTSLRKPRDHKIIDAISLIENDRSGFLELERTARYLQFKSQELQPEYFTALSATSIYDSMGVKRLVETVQKWREIQGIVRLLQERDIDIYQARSEVKSLIATICGEESYDDLCVSVSELSKHAAADLDSLLDHA